MLRFPRFTLQEVRAHGIEVGRAVVLGVVSPTGPLHLDHVGAQVGQVHRAVGCCEDPTEIEHARPRQGASEDGRWGRLSDMPVASVLGHTPYHRTAQ